MRFILAIAALLALPGGIVAAQDEAPQEAEAEETVTTAEEAVADRLVESHAKAAKAGDGGEVIKVLGEMSAFDNREFVKPATDALKWRASKADKKWAQAEAEELGLEKKSERYEILVERVSAVQAAAARVLANHAGDKKAASALAKAFKDKAVRKERPKALAAIILALGEIGQRKVESDVFSEFKSAKDPEVARACVRYFGTIRTKDYSIVRRLCNELSAPAPANVDSATNPPAAYWEQRWKIWNGIRRDISWSLKQITGQVFKPSEGEHPSDERKALAYVKQHKKELGLK